MQRDQVREKTRGESEIAQTDVGLRGVEKRSVQEVMYFEGLARLGGLVRNGRKNAFRDTVQQLGNGAIVEKLGKWAFLFRRSGSR